MADLVIRNCGTVWQFCPQTDDARRFLHEDCAHEGWQWLGDTLGVDHRYGVALAELAEHEGLTVSRQ